MPSWKQVQQEIKDSGSTHDVARRKFLADLQAHTNRNLIVYYSGWLEKGHLQAQGLVGFEVNDSDKNGFMAVIHGMDRDLGLDLILHTPGGDVAATESLVDYLRSMFGTDIRVIVPHLAMSAGTMIALAADSIVMGKHSSLGPIDPQIMGVPAHGIVEEFERARTEIGANPAAIPIWQPIIAKYTPTLVGQAQKAIAWSQQIVREWLETGMFRTQTDPTKRIAAIDKVLSSLNADTVPTHAMHVSLKQAKDMGLNVTALEADQQLQELVLTVHHACVQTLTDTPAFKLIENHTGVAFISSVQIQRT